MDEYAVINISAECQVSWVENNRAVVDAVFNEFVEKVRKLVVDLNKESSIFKAKVELDVIP